MCLAYQFELEVGVMKKFIPYEKIQSQVKKVFTAAKVTYHRKAIPGFFISW